MSRVVVVDDDQIFLSSIQGMLSAFNHDMIAVKDPLLASEVIISHNPDVILLDVVMKPINGIEVLKRIREEYKEMKNPVIFISGYPPNDEDLEEMFKLGALEFYSKPINVFTLNRMINQATLVQRQMTYIGEKEKILHSTRFPREYHQAGVSLFSYFGTVLRTKYRGTRARVLIEQDGLNVTMVIYPGEGERKIIEQALEEYGLVITYKIPINEYTDDELLELDIKNQLIIAKAQIETQKNLLAYQDEQLKKKDIQLDKFLSIMGKAFEKPIEVNIPITSTSEATITQKYQSAFQFSMIQSGLDELIERLPQDLEEVKIIQDLRKSLRQIMDKSPDEVRNSSGISQMRRVIEDIGNPESNIGKTIKGIEGVIDIAQDLAKHYNRIAQWCGLPQVPEPFLKN